MDTKAALGALGALAQESRLAVFRELVQAGPEGLPVGEIGSRLSLPGPTLSFHLAQLRASGLIGSRRQGRSLIYSADYSAMNDLIAFLLENCCGGKACCGVPPQASAPAPKRAPRRRRTA